MKTNIRSVALGAIVALAATASAQALNTRTWISGHGVDQSGRGPVASPCRTLQYAHDNTTDGGEIDVLDPAGYGSVSITKGINVINDGVGVAGVLASSGQNAITVSTTYPASVVLRGLTIEGSSVGANGIEFKGGGPLTVSNCAIQGFVGGNNAAGNGILIDPSGNPPATGGKTEVIVTNTTVSNNDYIGISFIPGLRAQGLPTTATISMDHVTAIKNKLGIAFYGGFAGTGKMEFNVSNSYIAHNQQIGLQFTNSTTAQQVDRGYFESNLIAENATGFAYGGGGSTGALIMFVSNNKIFLNTNDLASADGYTIIASTKNNYISTPTQSFLNTQTLTPN